MGSELPPRRRATQLLPRSRLRLVLYRLLHLFGGHSAFSAWPWQRSFWSDLPDDLACRRTPMLRHVICLLTAVMTHRSLPQTGYVVRFY